MRISSDVHAYLLSELDMSLRNSFGKPSMRNLARSSYAFARIATVVGVGALTGEAPLDGDGPLAIGRGLNIDRSLGVDASVP